MRKFEQVSSDVTTGLGTGDGGDSLYSVVPFLGKGAWGVGALYSDVQCIMGNGYGPL